MSTHDAFAIPGAVRMPIIGVSAGMAGPVARDGSHVVANRSRPILLAGCAGVNQTASRHRSHPSRRSHRRTSPHKSSFSARVGFDGRSAGRILASDAVDWCGTWIAAIIQRHLLQHVYDGAAESWFCALDDHLLTASDHNQAKALCFAQRHAVGDIGMPLDGIDEAFREHPDEILLLTMAISPTRATKSCASGWRV